MNFTRNQRGFGPFSIPSVLANDFLAFAFDTLAPRGAVGVADDLALAVFVSLCALRLRFRLLNAFGLALAIAIEVSPSILCEIVKGTIERLEIRLVAERSDGVIAARAQIGECVIAACVGRCCGRL